ncbi:mitochondrial cardiolipin hydrolase isoform X3 [Nerophis ophidion]|uniref:mitochondrial cardiolipin hydrolase isoform X3 n=1 Tax=Nerophis ophidion TaxID=159077 RepID=UPI002ADF3755|nr:mitochondrial cardiolipin hydrolase isoform X3 [Nerophis ophidion]
MDPMWRQTERLLSDRAQMWTVSALSLGAAVALSLSAELLCRYLHRSKRPRTLNEVIFFPSKVACVEHVFSPASPQAVLELHRRRITVRILVDKHYSVINGSQIGALRKAGICVRNVGRYVHMHHKFAVVDNRLLITGSLNWTLAAVQSNSENIIITEEPALVRPYIREFSRLWADNDPSENPPSTAQTLDCID